MTTTPHPYAEILRAVADGKEVQQHRSGEWQDVVSTDVLYAITMAHAATFRIKPATIRIGEFDVPEPLREAPPLNTVYHYPAVGIVQQTEWDRWAGSEYDQRLMERGLVHLTKEAAELHAKALLSFTEVKP